MRSGCLLGFSVRWTTSGWQVSSHGRVRSSRGVISYGNWSGAYRVVRIAGKQFYVHRLVAAAFLEQPSGTGPWQVNHIDGNSCNNCARNLQYATPSENVKHSFITSPERGVRQGKPVLWREHGAASWNACSSHVQAASMLGVCRYCVSKCCRGIRKVCIGNRTAYEFKCAAFKEPPCKDDEIWKVAHYPGRADALANIWVSSHGRIFFNSRQEGRLTRGTRTANGYYRVCAQQHTLLVHRLVAATFLGQPTSLSLHVNHKDRDPGNNRLNNLEYATPSENALHALRHTRTEDMERTGIAILAKLAASSEEWTRFKSVKAAIDRTGVSRATVMKMCRNEHVSGDSSWEFKFADAAIDGEEWRAVVLAGARTPKII